MTIKWHMLLHLSAVLAKFGGLPNTLVCERKHKLLKAFAEVMDHIHSGGLLL